MRLRTLLPVVLALAVALPVQAQDTPPDTIRVRGDAVVIVEDGTVQIHDGDRTRVVRLHTDGDLRDRLVTRGPGGTFVVDSDRFDMLGNRLRTESLAREARLQSELAGRLRDDVAVRFRDGIDGDVFEHFALDGSLKGVVAPMAPFGFDASPEVMRMEREAHRLAMRARQAEGDERAALERELRDHLETLFDRKLEARERRIEELASMLDRQRADYDARRAARDEIIGRRLSDLLGEDDVLDW